MCSGNLKGNNKCPAEQEKRYNLPYKKENFNADVTGKLLSSWFN